MSTVSQIPSSNSEADESHLHAEGEPLEGVLTRPRDGLVPADQLPSAVGVLAEIFPPEEHSASVLPAGASVGLSAMATEDFPDAPVVPVSTILDEPPVGERLPDGEFQKISASALSEPASQEGSPAAAGAMPDDLPNAASVSPEADFASRDSQEMAPRSRRKKSVFSGFAAATGGLLRSVVAAFAGESKHGVSKTPAANASEVVEDPVQAEQLALEDHPASETISIAEEHVPGEPGATVAAIRAIVTESSQESDSLTDDAPQGESGRVEEPSAQADSSANAEIPRAGQTEIPPDGSTQAPRPVQGSESTVTRSEGSEIQRQDAVQLDDIASWPTLAEGSAEDHTAFSDSSEGQHISKEEDEAVDASDDDEAIASAIERYANLIDPDRAKTLEPAESGADDHVQESAAEKADLNAILGIPRDAEPADSVLGYVVPPAQIPDMEQLTIAAGEIAASASEQAVADNPPQGIPEREPSASRIPTPPRSTSPRDWSFEEKLASHHEWIESKGATGRRIDFAAADLEGNDLIGADLRYMDLRDANLRAADLLMADLRDACLVRANFRDSCLVGANLEAANLEGASLETSMGLVPHQLAGANLHEAALPSHILQFEALSEFKRTSRTVYGYFVAMTSLSVLSWLIVWTTKDFQLVTNAAIVPFVHSSTAAAALPTVQFYLIAPFALFIVYLVFHFHLQHLWDAVLELPAVFPDGHALGENEPRIVVGLLRAHFRWMNQDAPSTRVIEKAIAILMAYWIVPVTLLLYWLRYLTLQEIHGTILQELLVVGAAGAALYSTTRVGRLAAKWTLEENIVERAFDKLRDINPVTTALVLLGALTFLSAGTIVGVPHGKDRAPQFWESSIRRWAPTVLWSFGIDPYADLTEAVISTKPANWNGSDDQVSAVKGARLNDANFRYAQAYRVFLANAHLLHAKFQGAFLPQADLRGADLGQSDLRYAILDQAQMNHANLDRAVLDGANLSRSDLRASNLSYASLAGATLVDARVDGATLYGAKLASATLIRTNFEKADLRESRLDGANLEHVDLQGAYLWSAKLPGARLNNAQLGTAIFVDADLRGADLRWAQLPGTVLTGADLTGALLDGADFRGAVGFGANQVCSAKSRKGLLLDSAMQAQVTAQCGAGN